MHCMMGVKIYLSSDIATSTQQVPTPPQVLIEKELGGVFADTFNFADVKDKWWMVVAAPLVTTVFVMLLYLVYIVVKQHRQSRELRVASPVDTPAIEILDMTSAASNAIDDSMQSLISSNDSTSSHG